MCTKSNAFFHTGKVYTASFLKTINSLELKTKPGTISFYKNKKGANTI